MKSYFPNISLPQALLSFLFYLSLIRGTNIGLFYPADEFKLADINYMPQTIMNVVLLAGIVLYFFVMKNFRFIFQSLSQAFIGSICAGILISLAFSVDLMQSTKYVVAMTVVSLPTILYFREHGAEKLMTAFSRFAVVMAFANIVYLFLFPEYAIMVERHDGRWKGLFEHKNVAGIFFAFAFFMILLGVQLKANAALIIKAIALLICLAFIVFAQSSSASLSFVMMLVLYPSFMMLLKMNNAKERIGTVMFAISLVLLAFTFLGSQIEQLFFDLTGKDATLTGRTSVWGVIFDLVAQRPLVGFGPGMSERNDFMEQIQGGVGWEVKGTHNSYLDLAICYGYPTTIFMVALLLRMWLQFFSIQVWNKLDLKLAAMAATLVLTVLITGTANASLIFSRSFLWTITIAGLLIITNLRRRKVSRHIAEQ